MASADILKAAIIGAGRVAGLLENDSLRDHPCTHWGIYNSHPSIVVTGVCSADRANAESFAAEFGISNFYHDYKEIINKEKPQILSVCTPAEIRYKIITYALRKNIPVIVTEKPLALNIREHEAIISLAAKKKSTIFVNHLRRFSWDWQIVKKILLEKKIGKPLFSKGSFSGAFLHTGTHMFDMINYLFGPPKSIRGDIYNDEGKKIKCFRKKIYDGGVRGYMNFTDNHRIYIDGQQKEYFQFELEINGSSGRIRIGNHLNELWLKTDCEYATEFSQIKKFPFPEPAVKKNPWLMLRDEIYNSARGLKNDRNMTVDSLTAYEMALAFALSSKRGKTVKLPLRKNKKIKILAY